MEYECKYSSNLIPMMYPNWKHNATTLVSELKASKYFSSVNTPVTMENNIKRIRKDRGLSLEDVAQLAKTTRATIMKLERGNMQLTHEWMKRIAIALHIRPQDLISDETIKKIKVLSYIGTGAEVFIINDHSMGISLEEVDPPVGYYADGITAVRVHGDSMEPQFEEGWLIFYNKQHDGVPSDCIGELCVVKLPNDGLFVRKIRDGSKQGLYHLISKNSSHEPMFDVKVEWATRILDIRPR